LWTNGWDQWYVAGALPDLFPEASPLDQLADANEGFADYMHQLQQSGLFPSFRSHRH